MQSSLLPSSPFLLLSLLFLSTFHGQLLHAQTINFPSGKFTADQLTSLQHASVDSSGALTLDSTSGDAQAFYGTSISVLNSLGTSVQSFASIFTIGSDLSSGNGSIVLALMPDTKGGLAEARKTLTIEFNTSCSAGGPYGGDWDFGGRGYQGRRGGYWGGGRFSGGFGGFQVVEYANNTPIQSQYVGGLGDGWTGQPPQGPYFCNQNLSAPTFQYQVAVEYNATTDAVLVGSPSCGAGIILTKQFSVPNLSAIITKPVFVGFFASGGGIFNITQWNFTTNTNSSTVANLAVSSGDSTTTDGTFNGGRGHSGSKLKKGYVIAFSILGAAIGVAAVLLVCCLCARRRRVTTTGRFVRKSVHEGTIPESAVVFDAKKPPAPPAKVVLVERDTTPLNTNSNSAFHGSKGAATWLQPVAPR